MWHFPNMRFQSPSIFQIWCWWQKTEIWYLAPWVSDTESCNFVRPWFIDAKRMQIPSGANSWIWSRTAKAWHLTPRSIFDFARAGRRRGACSASKSPLPQNGGCDAFECTCEIEKPPGGTCSLSQKKPHCNIIFSHNTTIIGPWAEKRHNFVVPS